MTGQQLHFLGQDDVGRRGLTGPQRPIKVPHNKAEWHVHVHGRLPPSEFHH